MVSPLKTWKHPESEQLWPILGGLSVLAHIGILGFSLPYVFELMQTSGSSESAATIPIELIVEPSQNPDDAVSNQIQSTDTGPIQPEVSSNESDAISGAEATPLFQEPSTNAAPLEPTPTATKAESQERQSSDRSTSTSSGSTNEESGGTAETESSTSSTDSPESTSPSPAQDTESQTTGSGEDNLEASNNEPTELPTIASEGVLPAPEELTQAANARSLQSAALSIVDFSEVDGIQRDVGKTPPRPKEGNLSSAIVLNPSDAGCGRLEFSQQQWVYRVAVRENGTIQTATPWTGGISKPLSIEEEAITCLIENAGFEFEPALFDGQPILDDNLLLTISLIEVPQ